MKFVIVILFATMGDLYVFTEPSFETKNECMEFLLKEESKELILTKLYMEYGKPRAIQALNCIEQKEFERIIRGTQEI
tara:strand:+ start:685 stop:918 length:234 start_codon:yes stop_codon:yes gene_type:complete